MRALMVNSLTAGGAERVVINIFKELRNQGKDIVLICLVKNNTYKIENEDNIIYLSNLKSFKRGFGLMKLFAYPLIVYRLLKIIKKQKIDLVQSHLYSSSIINAIVKKLGGRHIVQVVNHSHINRDKYGSLSGRIKLFSLKFAYNSADMVISISKKMKADIDQIILKKDVKHIVIPNPHNIEEIIAKAQEPADFNFDHTKTYLVTASRLIPSKKIDILLGAFSKIKKEKPEIELLIVGDGEERAKLESLRTQLKLEDSVHFIGFVSNPFKYIAKSDVFVMTSASEGLPNVLFESMLCKTRIVSTDCSSGPREILAPDSDFNKVLTGGIEIGKHGALCPVNDEQNIIEAIKYSLGLNRDEIDKMVEDGFNYALNFSIDKIAGIYYNHMN
jgi:N-acetylgalactosamine-N,N'-diacetylbacillosaminyl-diphospho-undecaprenol 4-alpha-N-acetylgalactosaminyltransferase